MQLEGPHGEGVTHSCPAQTVPPVHVPHAWPALPHAAFCVPVTHTPPRQHPEHVPGPHVASQQPPQLEGPHGADVHTPFVQFVPVPHARHAPP